MGVGGGGGNRNYIQSSRRAGSGAEVAQVSSIHPCNSPLFFPFFFVSLHFLSPHLTKAPFPFFFFLGGATLICRCIKYIIRGYNLRKAASSNQIRSSARSQHPELAGATKVWYSGWKYVIKMGYIYQIYSVCYKKKSMYKTYFRYIPIFCIYIITIF